jgi:hypothetical protein
MYRYTYATLRNRTGFFGPGKGPGDFSVKRGYRGRAKVKQGAAKFGGTMTMLGALTSKALLFVDPGVLNYFYALGENNWRYDLIGTSAPTKSGVVTNG